MGVQSVAPDSWQAMRWTQELDHRRSEGLGERLPQKLVRRETCRKWTVF